MSFQNFHCFYGCNALTFALFASHNVAQVSMSHVKLNIQLQSQIQKNSQTNSWIHTYLDRYSSNKNALIRCTCNDKRIIDTHTYASCKHSHCSYTYSQISILDVFDNYIRMHSYRKFMWMFMSLSYCEGLYTNCKA